MLQFLPFLIQALGTTGGAGGPASAAKAGFSALSEMGKKDSSLPGQEAAAMGAQQQSMIDAQLQGNPEFSNNPPSLAGVGDPAVQTSNFEPWSSPGVLPDRGSVTPQPNLPYSGLAGGIQQAQTSSARPTSAQLNASPVPAPGFNPFNFTGSASLDPKSTAAPDPNMFLRMTEGYNRGGLMGSLGQLLTNYK